MQGNRIDLSKLESLFRQHYKALCGASHSITGNEDAARDLVQDFFLLCWKRRDELVIVDDFKRYAVRAVKNSSLNYIRNSRKVLASADLETIADKEETGLYDDKSIERRNKALWEAIGQLPEKRRQIFLASNKDDLSYVQIADEFQISVNTVKTQIKLAYLFLRKECDWLLYSQILLFIFKIWQIDSPFSTQLVL